MKFRDFFIPTSRNNFKAILLRSESIAVLTVLMFAFDSILGILPTTVTNAELDMNSLAYLHNKERTQAGITTLDLNSLLITSATNKADAMLESDCWDHYCPPGVSPWTFFNQAGYEYMHAGENLGEGFSDNSTLMRAWMNSPTHKANVLKPEYKEFGIGFATGTFQSKEDNTIAVVHFGTRMDQATATPVPTSTPAPTPNPTPQPTTVTTTPTPVVTPVVTPNTVTPAPTIRPATPVPTPIPTVVETLSEERTEEEVLKNLTISFPQNNETYIEAVTEIKGIADPGIELIQLTINGQEFTSVTAENGIYSFKSTANSELNLGNGTYEITVTGYNANRELISESSSIIFTVSVTQDPIHEEDIKVEEIIQKDYELGVVINYMPQAIKPEIVELFIDNLRVLGLNTENGFDFETDRDTINAAQNVTLKVTTTQGKTYEYEIDKEYLQTEVSKLMLKNNIDDTSLSIETFMQLPSQSNFNVDFSFLSLKGKVNLVLLSFLLILFVVDYVVISKLAHIKDNRITHNHHLSIGFIVVLIIMSLLSAGVGNIAVGLSS